MMKHFLKMLAIALWFTLVLATGYWLVLNNLSRLLGAERFKFDCHLATNRLVITAGQWHNQIRFDTPLKIWRTHREWRINSPIGTLSVATQPGLEIHWENPAKRRSSKMDGEY